MTTFAPVMEAHASRAPNEDPAAIDACMFCDPAMGHAAAGRDPLAFRAHLAAHQHCATEYEMWKQVITDEWNGD